MGVTEYGVSKGPKGKHGPKANYGQGTEWVGIGMKVGGGRTKMRPEKKLGRN